MKMHLPEYARDQGYMLCLASKNDKKELGKMKVISVFGSASPKAGSADYAQACLVGKLLAKAGFAVATGGYVGTMEAVSKGASEAGGHVIGVTCTSVEDFRMGGANRWVAEEIRFETLRERLLHLVLNNDGVIVLPGGIGTLVEMAMAWNLVQIGEIPPRPLVLLGELWRGMVEAFVQPQYVREADAKLVVVANSAETAVATITRALT